MATQDDVTVGIGGENRRLKSSLTESRRLVSQFASTGTSALAPFGRALKGTFDRVFSLQGVIATLAGTGGIGLLVTSSNRAAAEIASMADTAGVGVEALQELTNASSQAGVKTDALVDGLKELQLRADEFAVAGKGPAAEAFQRLGLSREETAERLQRPVDLMEEIIERVGTLNDAAQIRVFDEIFGGTAGEQFTRFLELGEGGIARLRKEARDLGLVLDSVMVRDAQRSEAQLRRVGNVLRTNVTRAVLALTPQVIALAEGFSKWLIPALSRIESLLPDTAVASDELKRRMGALRIEIESLAGISLRDLLALPDFSRFDRETRTTLAGLLRDYQRLGDLLLERRRKEKLVEDGLNASSGANETNAAKIRDVAEAIQFEIDQLGRSQVQQDLYTEAKKAGVEVHGAFAASIEPLLNKLAEEKAAMDATTEAAKTLQGAEAERLRQAATIFEQTRTPFEAYQQQLVDLNDLQQRGLITLETYLRAVTQAQDTLAKATEETDTLKSAQDRLESGLDRGAQAFARFAMTGKLEFRSMVDSMLADLLRLQVRQNLISPLFNALSGGLSGIFSGGSSSGGGGAVPVQAQIAHGGGIAGGGGPRRSIPAAAFKGASRFHQGGEVPVIARPGEGIFTPQQMQNANALFQRLTKNPVAFNLKIVNNTGASVTTTERDNESGGRDMDIVLDEMVATNISRGGETARAIQSLTGLSSRAVVR